MIKPCRKVLKELRKLSSNSECTLCFLGDTNCICRSDNYTQTYDYSKYSGEIHSIISHLVQDGFLIYSFNEYFFSITQKGLHPHLFTWETIRRFLFTSILVPIFVSLATTLLTLLIRGLLLLP